MFDYDPLLALQMREVIQGRNYAAPAPAVRYSYCKKTNKQDRADKARRYGKQELHFKNF